MNEYKSQCQLGLDHLRSGRKITTLDAWQYGIAHLPRRIKDLEERGHIINRETIDVTKANGKIAHVTEYSYAAENFAPVQLEFHL